MTDDAPPRTEELVYTVTADGLPLEGVAVEVLPAQPYAPFYRQSAASIVSRAAVVDRLAASGIAAIRCPVLAFAGDAEPGGPPDVTASKFTGAARVDIHRIANADHFYTGCEYQVAGVLAEWAATL